ncbi:MAG: GTP cyclohydrolase I FolE [Muribaculaceae bacterium]|nr:GTP cyclohydrolase I FolE [Muribaculaceae bacterium]MBR0025462.1 GTP cyclohydrolase I FolE [Muribaculaceae bacterium]
MSNNKKPQYDNQQVEKLAAHIKSIIELLGEDPNREGLLKTPQRAAKALIDNTSGYSTDGGSLIRQALFTHDSHQMVIVKDIEFYSLCEHHILPFFGTVSIGYIPDGEIVGLSKLARVVETHARRLQVQERLTADICKVVSENIKNKGVIVACEAAHMCMKMRGIEKQETTTVTIEYCGDFESVELQQQFFTLCKLKNN